MSIEFVYNKTHICLNPTRPFTKALEKKLNMIHNQVMNDVVFSRFKYHISKKLTNMKIPDSKYSIIKMKEGNCVAFSYYTKFILNKNGFNDAYIISSCPPKLFKRDGYLPLSHAAVVLPCKSGYVLFDPSFYFPNVVYIDIQNKSMQQMSVKNVYSKQYAIWNFNITNSMTNENENEIGNEIIQHIPKDTPIIKATFHEQLCLYILREIINPDECITIPTNIVDKRIFYCKITRDFDIDLYYAFDFNDNRNILKGSSLNNDNIPTIHINDIKTNSFKLDEWIELFNITDNKEKRKMKSNINTFIKLYIL